MGPHDSYALRGKAKTLSSLGRVDEAIETYCRAAEVGGSGEDFDAAVSGLERMREDLLKREGETDRARWIASVLRRLRDC